LSATVVVGAGRMGRGIAQVFAYAGNQVTLLDIKDRPQDDRERLFSSARNEIRENLQFLSAEGLFDEAEIQPILDRIHLEGVEKSARIIASANFVFEAVPEVLEAKRLTLEVIGRHARADAIVSSTTSTILVDTLAEFLPHPERFVNAHWLNPAYLIPLVEVSPGDKTDEKSTKSLKSLLESVGKVPVECKASPGFIIPRIQVVALNEAARIVEEGVATAEEVDKAIRVGFGVRFATMGLLEFIDWGGGDILFHASKYLEGALGSDRYRAPEVIDRNMKEGNIGMDAGNGFYCFENMDVSSYRKEMLSRFVGLIRHMDLLHEPETTSTAKQEKEPNNG
jgi:3-hydroxybutyryl-CoA dehydrogenase